MTQTSTRYSLTTAISEAEKQKQARFALLALVGRRKKAHSLLQEETTHYSSIATEALAGLAGLLHELEELETTPEIGNLLAAYTSLRIRLTDQLLAFSPQSSESAERLSDLLDYDGLATVLDVTSDGYVTQSTDLILRNVERVIALTKVPYLKPSLHCPAQMPLLPAGTDGEEYQSS